MKTDPFSDGSNDTDTEEMNPITVKMFDASQGMIVTRFLDMCSTTGKNNKHLTVHVHYKMIHT